LISPTTPSPNPLTDTSRFCPDNFAKDFFVPKKQKHEMRLTNGLAKNWLKVLNISFCFAILLQFRQKEQNLAVKRSMNIGTLFNFGFG